MSDTPTSTNDVPDSIANAPTLALKPHGFIYRADSPRQLEITGVGTRLVWDVIGRCRPAPRSHSF